MNVKHILALTFFIILAIYLRAIQQTSPYTYLVLDSNSGFIEHGIWLLTTISYGLGVEFYVKCLFTLVAALTVFYLARELTGGDSAGLIAVGLFSISTIAVFFENFGLWDGQSFTPVFGLAALLLLLVFWRTKKWYIGALSLGIAIFIYFFWTGGEYWLIAYFVAMFFIWEDSRRFMPLLMCISIIMFFALNFPYHTQGGPSSDGMLEIAFQYFGSIIAPSWIPVSYIPEFAVLFLFTCLVLFTIPAIYTIIYFESRNPRHRRAYHGLLALLIIAVPFVAWDAQWLVLTYLPMIVFAGAGLDGLLPLIKAKSEGI